MSCVFCDIVDKKIPAKVVYEDENYMAFHDIAPKMKTHLLIIPKKHIERFDSLRSEEGIWGQKSIGEVWRENLDLKDRKGGVFYDEERENLEIVKWLFEVAYKIIKQYWLNWCRLQINCWKDHGQEVFHIHLHLMSHSSLRSEE